MVEHQELVSILRSDGTHDLVPLVFLNLIGAQGALFAHIVACVVYSRQG